MKTKIIEKILIIIIEIALTLKDTRVDVDQSSQHKHQ